MIRFFKAIFLVAAVTLPIGCNNNAPPKTEPIWQQVKITDIIPFRNAKHPDSQLLKTVNLDIYVFEMPARNTDALAELWQALYSRQLRFNDYDTFCANSFSAGFGQLQMWNKIVDLLRASGGKKVETVSLLLFDGQPWDFTIATINKQRTIFYVPGTGPIEGVTIGPGKLVLRIKAEKIPASKGICNVSFQPVFSSQAKGPILQSEARTKTDDIIFTSTGFELKMSPGNFVLLGPKKYTDQQITLSGSFFSRFRKEAMTRIYLCICTRIND